MINGLIVKFIEIWGIEEIRLIRYDGRVVRSKMVLGACQVNISIDGLKSGLYLIESIDASEKSKYYEFIIA